MDYGEDAECCGNDDGEEADGDDDETTNELDVALCVAENNTAGMDDFLIINTNARSLCPKINSFIDCYNELDAKLAIVTETWFGNSRQLDTDLEDLLHGTGIATVSYTHLTLPTIYSV